MGTIVERLKMYIDFKGLSVSIAEKEIGVSNATLSKPFKAKTTIKTDTLEKFLSTYSDINPDWLLNGVGLMTKKEDQLNYVEEDQEAYNINYKDLAESRKETIECLKKEIGHLEEKIGLLSNKRKAG